MLRWTIGFVALFASCAPATARAPQVLAPSGDWQPLKSPHSCKFARSFGEGRKRTVAILERIAPGAKLSLMVFGPGLRSSPAAWGSQMRFLPHSDRVFKDGLSARTAKGDTAIQWSSVDFAADTGPPGMIGAMLSHKLEQSAAAEVTGIAISEPGGNRLELQTGAMTQVQDLLEGCAREQLRSWGLDPAVRGRIVVGATSDRNPAEFISEHDYPILALRFGGEAIFSVRLIVGADGRVAKCTTITDFAEPEMEEIVCRGLSKARFQPAMLADGTKVPDFALVRIRFGMAP